MIQFIYLFPTEHRYADDFALARGSIWMFFFPNWPNLSAEVNASLTPVDMLFYLLTG